MSYINTMEELKRKVENVLRTDIRTYIGNYKQVYFEVFKKHWVGCNCNTSTLKESLRTWLNNNNK